jgi:biopolymer transport protein ExbD
LLFELAADGSMRLNREPVDREALLAERFAQAAAQRPQPELQLRIDASVSYAQISRIFLLAQEQGLNSMSLVMDQGAAAVSTASRTKP